MAGYLHLAKINQLRSHLANICRQYSKLSTRYLCCFHHYKMPQTAASEKVKLPGKDPDHPAPETQSSDSDLVISDSGVVDVDGRKPASVQEKRAAEDQEETG